MSARMTLLRKWGSDNSLEKEMRIRKLNPKISLKIRGSSSSRISDSEPNLNSPQFLHRSALNLKALPITPRIPVAMEEKRAWERSEESVSLSGLPPISGRQFGTIATLAMASYFSTIMISSIAPFFPLEARKMGASSSEIAFIFGVFELSVVIMGPFCAKYMTFLGSKNMFVSGVLLEGAATVFLGFAKDFEKGLPFVSGCMLARIIQAIGDAAFFSSSVAIIANEFPERVGTMVALIETFIGLGVAMGPPLSGALYQFGGFKVPFVFNGISLFIIGIAGIVFVSSQEDVAPPKIGSIWELLQVPEILLMCAAVVSGVACINFLDPTLQLHLQEFNLPPFFVGLMFLAVSGVYTTAAPFWRHVTDRLWINWEVMVCGVFLTVLSMLFIGPAPFIPAEKSIVSIGCSEVLLGLGASAVYVPAFENALEILRKYNYPDSFATYSLVSGLFQTSFSFGGFLGPTVGGVLAGSIGFSWTATIFCSVNFIVLSLLISHLIYNRCVTKTPRRTESEDLMKIMSDSALVTSDLGKPPSEEESWNLEVRTFGSMYVVQVFIVCSLFGANLGRTIILRNTRTIPPQVEQWRIVAAVFYLRDILYMPLRMQIPNKENVGLKTKKIKSLLPADLFQNGAPSSRETKRNNSGSACSPVSCGDRELKPN